MDAKKCFFGSAVMFITIQVLAGVSLMILLLSGKSIRKDLSTSTTSDNGTDSLFSPDYENNSTNQTFDYENNPTNQTFDSGNNSTNQPSTDNPTVLNMTILSSNITWQQNKTESEFAIFNNSTFFSENDTYYWQNSTNQTITLITLIRNMSQIINILNGTNYTEPISTTSSLETKNESFAEDKEHLDMVLELKELNNKFDGIQRDIKSLVTRQQATKKTSNFDMIKQNFEHFTEKMTNTLSYFNNFEPTFMRQHHGEILRELVKLRDDMDDVVSKTTYIQTDIKSIEARLTQLEPMAKTLDRVDKNTQKINTRLDTLEKNTQEIIRIVKPTTNNSRHIKRPSPQRSTRPQRRRDTNQTTST